MAGVTRKVKRFTRKKIDIIIRKLLLPINVPLAYSKLYTKSVLIIAVTKEMRFLEFPPPDGVRPGYIIWVILRFRFRREKIRPAICCGAVDRKRRHIYDNKRSAHIIFNFCIISSNIICF